MQLTIENLIKIIIGVSVFVIVILGVYFFFKNYVLEFFKGGEELTNLVLGLLK